MPSPLDKIIESFPYPMILTIIDQPYYKTLAEIHIKINTNAALVHYQLGNDQLVLLYLTVLPDVYNTQSAIIFVPIANMVPSLTIPNGSTGPQIISIYVQHDMNKKLYREYDITDKALKYLLTLPSTRLIYVSSVTSTSVTPTSSPCKCWRTSTLLTPKSPKVISKRTISACTRIMMWTNQWRFSSNR